MTIAFNTKAFGLLARILPISLGLLACTTPQSQSRLRLQRQGSQPDWQQHPWSTVAKPWLGESFSEPEGLAERLQARLNQDLEARNLPKNKKLHLVLGRPRIACDAVGKRWRCYSQVIVEMRGARGKRALWAAEGLAWLELDRPPPLDARNTLALGLVRAAIQSVREGPQSRPAGRWAGPLATAIQLGKPGTLDHWLVSLAGDESSEAQRVALWLAVGHLAEEKDRQRIEDVKARTPRENKARQLALDWLDELKGSRD